MSRLTASPFHKPAPFEFPRVPLSPPETNAEIIGPSRMASSGSLLGPNDHRHGDIEPSPALSAPTPESAGARFRKISSIAYHTSGLRESRERTPQRGSKAFVIIIPPSSFTQEHGQLGSTLSCGPRYRLSQGLLMPLFPTMYGQLAAIAREFNFPSTTGLCLYPHFLDNGVTMTPRVSDEFWPYIWSHVFDANATVRPPISGKIEFDIDIRQARWYTSWMASSHRDYVDHPFSANPSVAPSVTHHERGESKTTFQDVDDEEPRFAAPVTRHVPRKLSLVDRYDMMSVRSGTRHGSRSALSPPEQVHPSSQVLSPIFQEEEPKSAKHDLDSRVKSWRASAVLKPTPLAATGQTSLEPVNMPNTLPIEDDLLATPDEELNLADFAWSVSSEGPNDYDPMSPMSWDHVPSVHIAHRMEGSVCLTPTTYTSFGPSDYTLSSPGSSIYRLPSPDIARRMYEDVPPTPSTVTSWGPVASLPSSPLYSEYRSRSVHLGDRGDYSRPVTPSTATSWGAPLSYPPSPSTPFYMNTPDAGHRGFEDSEMFVRHMPWGHSWPYKMKSSISRSGDLQCPVTDGAIVPSRHSQQAIPWVLSWPAWSVGAQQYATVHSSQSHQLTPWAFSWPARSVDARTRSLVLPSSLNPPQEQTSPWAYSWPYRGISRSVDAQALPPPQQVVSPWAHSWPYQGVPPSPNAHTHTPWEHLWPYIGTSQSVDVQAPQKAVSPWVHSWPYQGISRPGGVKTRSPWAHSWPYSVQSGEVDVLVSSATQETCSLGSLQQGTVPWSLLWPYRSLKEDSGPIFTHLPLAYPRLVLYQPVYPHFDLYPEVAPKMEACLGYPHFNLYPSLPCDAAKRIPTSTPAMTTTSASPSCNLYPAGYPANLSVIYPPVIFKEHSNIQVLVLADLSQYPHFDLYPVREKFKVYPEFDLYPAIKVEEGRKKGNYPEFNICPIVEGSYLESSASYPDFNLYPDVKNSVTSSGKAVGYPDFNLYPSTRQRLTGYHHFDLYTPVSVPEHNIRGNPNFTGYPNFDLYPDANISGTKSKSSQSSGYPDFDLYPVVGTSASHTIFSASYPDFDLYPVAGTSASHAISSASYPDFDLYPVAGTSASHAIYSASYPDFDLYPVVGTSASHAIYSASYPDFDIYPQLKIENEFSTYPNFNLYPPIDLSRTSSKNAVGRTISVNVRYPHFNLYPVLDPKFDLGPTVKDCEDYPDVSISGYPHFSLYSPVKKPATNPGRVAVYPIFDLYPTLPPDTHPLVTRETVADQDRSGYPYFELYRSSSRGKCTSISIRAPSEYPNFNLYPAADPFVEVYPSPAKPLETVEALGYPDFNLYPPDLPSASPAARADKPAYYPNFNLYPVVYPDFDLYPHSADRVGSSDVISVKVEPLYPAFNLYAAVYPYFDLWPTMDQPRILQIPRPKPSIRSASRLTHSELHAMVMMERMGSAGSFSLLAESSPTRAVKSHDNLHHAVFPNGIVSTPSGTGNAKHSELGSTNKSLSEELLARRKISNLRTSIARSTLPLAPSPTRSLPPPPPTQTTRLSSGRESPQGSDTVPPLRPSPQRRILSSRFTQEPEQPQRLSISRSASLVKPSSLTPELYGELNRSSSLSMTPKPPPPGRRDSLVSQRVRAYNSSLDGTQLSMETLSKFPAPPIPLVPRVTAPKALDHSKYPFTR